MKLPQTRQLITLSTAYSKMKRAAALWSLTCLRIESHPLQFSRSWSYLSRTKRSEPSIFATMLSQMMVHSSLSRLSSTMRSSPSCFSKWTPLGTRSFSTSKSIQLQTSTKLTSRRCPKWSKRSSMSRRKQLSHFMTALRIRWSETRFRIWWHPIASSC